MPWGSVTCTSSSYKPSGQENYLDITFSGMKNGTLSLDPGKLWCDPNHSGKCDGKMTLNNPGDLLCDLDVPGDCDDSMNLKPWGNYELLSTDYDSYTIVFSCNGIIGFGNLTFLFLLTRKPMVPDSDEAKAMIIKL
jgi:hypothetical protein